MRANATPALLQKRTASDSRAKRTNELGPLRCLRGAAGARSPAMQVALSSPGSCWAAMFSRRTGYAAPAPEERRTVFAVRASRPRFIEAHAAPRPVRPPVVLWCCTTGAAAPHQARTEPPKGCALPSGRNLPECSNYDHFVLARKRQGSVFFIRMKCENPDWFIERRDLSGEIGAVPGLCPNSSPSPIQA